MRLALIGDVGGHRSHLERTLEGLGASVADAHLPDHLVVVQLGDLIDRGPDSPGCVELADRFMRAHPGRWLQLVGNHEGNRLGGPTFWDEELAPPGLATLRSWWDDGLVGLGVALSCPALGGEVLVTHGGLVPALWQLLGQPDATRAATILNSWIPGRADLAFAPGALLGGALPGPAWASAADELYGPWLDAGTAPFSQVHGHSSACEWPSGRVHPGLPRSLRRRICGDASTRHVRVELAGHVLVGIDPCLGFDPGDARITPLVVEGDVTAGPGH